MRTDRVLNLWEAQDLLRAHFFQLLGVVVDAQVEDGDLVIKLTLPINSSLPQILTIEPRAIMDGLVQEGRSA